MRTSTRGKGPFVAAAVAVLAIAVAGCGEKQDRVAPGEPTPIDVALDFYVNPDHAGLLVARDLGYFRRAGLDVRLRTPSDPSAPIRQLAAGRADLAVSYEPETILAANEDLDLVAIAALVDRPLTSLIWLPESGIEGPQSLRGKTVATAGIPYQRDYLRTILEAKGISETEVDVVNVGLGLLPALLGGRADAVLGAFSNIEGVELERRGTDPEIVPVDELGVPTYDELVLVARRETVDEMTQELELFLKALADGTAAAVDDPSLAARAVIEAGDGLDPAATKAQVTATLPLLATPPGRRFGQMDSEQWANFAAWMSSQGLIGDPPSGDELITNELLPPLPRD